MINHSNPAQRTHLRFLQVQSNNNLEEFTTKNWANSDSKILRAIYFQSSITGKQPLLEKEFNNAISML